MEAINGTNFIMQTNGITFLKKTYWCRSCHCCKEVWKGSEQFNARKKGKTSRKKSQNVYGEFILKNLLWNVFSKNDVWCSRKEFLNLGLFIC